jgi:hypothetical protein
MILHQLSSSPNGLNAIEEVHDEVDLESANRKNPPPKQQSQNDDFKQFIRSKLFIFTLLVALTGICILSVGFLISYERGNDIALTVDAWKEKLSNGEQTNDGIYDCGFLM